MIDIGKTVNDIVFKTDAEDIHTYLFDPQFKSHFLWGIDELWGTSFTPYHSDARTFEQIIYKWNHSREIISVILTEKYTKLRNSGWDITGKDIQRDVDNLFGGAFNSFIRN